jgi:hypothetical protein
MVDLLRQFLHNPAPLSFPGFLVEVSSKIPLNRLVFKEKMSRRAFYLYFADDYGLRRINDH